MAYQQLQHLLLFHLSGKIRLVVLKYHKFGTKMQQTCYKLIKTGRPRLKWPFATMNTTCRRREAMTRFSWGPCWLVFFFFFTTTVIQSTRNSRKTFFHTSVIYHANDMLVGENANKLSHWFASWISLCLLMSVWQNRDLCRMRKKDSLKTFLCVSKCCRGHGSVHLHSADGRRRDSLHFFF